MTQKDMDTLVKLMQLTASENDHEALCALRKANAILARHRVNWAGLVVMLKKLGEQEHARATAMQPGGISVRFYSWGGTATR
jgi:hypothetical protein